MKFFITGGSRGIGAAIVEATVKAGHDVAFTYLQAKDAASSVQERCKEQSPAQQCLAYQLDVSNSAQVEKVGDQVLEDLGEPEVVVNCAGRNEDGLLVSMSDEQWQGVLGTNLNGPFYVCRFFLPIMMSNRFGRIINISSIGAEGSSGQANYSASKAGLIGLTKTIAKEYGRKGITANVISPGIFETDMTKETMPQRVLDHWKMHCPVPGGRPGVSAEVAPLVLFLASQQASYINAEVINLTGGLNWTD